MHGDRVAVGVLQLSCSGHMHGGLCVRAEALHTPFPMPQALNDAEAAVLSEAVTCLITVAPHLCKRSLLDAVARVVPLLDCANSAVRAISFRFVAAAAAALPAADIAAQLQPLLAAMGASLSWQHHQVLSEEGTLARCLHSLPTSMSRGGRVGSPCAGSPADCRPRSSSQRVGALSSPSWQQEQHQRYKGLSTDGCSISSTGSSPTHAGWRTPAAGLEMAVDPTFSRCLLPPQAPLYCMDLPPNSGLAETAHGVCINRVASSAAGLLVTASHGGAVLDTGEVVPHSAITVPEAFDNHHSHQRAVASISTRCSALQEQVAALRVRATQEPGGLEMAERLQLERLHAALAR